MNISIPDRVVVFDYGEVISLSQTAADKAAILAIVGSPADRFWASYWDHREPLDQGTITLPQYWALVAADLGEI